MVFHLRQFGKNKIDEIYGEDSIEVLYLEDRQMNSKIIYKEEGGGWKYKENHRGAGSERL